MIKNRQQNFLLNQQISFCSVCSIDRTITEFHLFSSHTSLYTWTKYDILVAKYHSRLHHLLLIKYAKLIMPMYFDLNFKLKLYQ